MFGAIWAAFGAETAFVFSAAISIVAAALLLTVQVEQGSSLEKPARE
jgi:hypothetical protein